MAAILVLATFAIFILIDWILSRGRVPHQARLAAAAPEPAGFSGHRMVEGFLVPEEVQYHPGHTWVQQERRNLERVGVDEFGAALAGAIEKIELPRKGQWIRQGQKAITVYRGGEKIELVSPTEGEVVKVNEDLVNNPALLRQDPYGRGWAVVVNVPDEESVSRNLVPPGLAPAWMRDAVNRLYALQPQLAGAVAADGGRPAGDLLAGIAGVSWRQVAGELFLTAERPVVKHNSLL
jgi:glycine cleavage system H protein